MNHKTFSILLLAVGIVFVERAIDTDNIELDKIATKLFSMGLLLVVGTLYELFWINRRHDASAKIFGHAVATACYVGSVWIALAIAGLIGL